MLAEYFWSRSEMMMMRLALVLFLSFVSPSPVLSRPLSPCLSSFPVVRRSVSDLSCYLSHCHPSFHVLCLTVSGSFMFFVSPSPVLSRPSSRCLSVACPLMFFVSLSLVLSCLLSLYCISCHFLPNSQCVTLPFLSFACLSHVLSSPLSHCLSPVLSLSLRTACLLSFHARNVCLLLCISVLCSPRLHIYMYSISLYPSFHKYLYSLPPVFFLLFALFLPLTSLSLLPRESCL